MAIETVGVLGCGLMGAGIAEVAARAGHPVVVREISDELLEQGLGRIRSSLEGARDRGKLDASACAAAVARVTGDVAVEALGDCDLVVEAATENLEIKKKVLAEVDEVLGDAAVLATNTSSLTVTELAMATARPERFVGLHFFNPVPVMRLVEVVETLVSSPEALAAVTDFVAGLGKEAIRCKDRSGFIVNRLLVPYLLDAIRAFENGTGSLEDIDQGMKLGCGHPMGPFTLMDFIGLDTMHSIAEVMFAEYRESRFAPPPLLKQMVQAGRLGRKSGRGFYRYG
ncbi:MAG: 3-hydroxybutyryl-CoA dehydrogenase [Thermoanaerobaculia bacterium]|nr:3-hydroxybutyryl-CoA dehydrogenase [Thermoanaerobaculia bacterium]